jgi:sugar phosphate isomerase/epimerase
MSGSGPYGCSTFCCMDLSLEEALHLIREKTDRIEIMCDGLHDLFRHVAACSCIEARYSVHVPGADVNLASTNERVRRTGIGVIGDLCEICDAISASTLVVHPGYSAWSQVHAESYAALLRSLDDLAVLQASYRVRIAPENMGSWECCHFRSPELLQELREREFGYTLDIGHAHLNNQVHAFLAEYPPVHVHLHDNGGEIDDHAACGTGSIDFGEVLPLLPSDVLRIIEVTSFGDFGSSLDFLQNSVERPRSIND